MAYFGSDMAAFMAAALIHEAGHLAAIMLLTRGKTELELTAAGAYIYPRYKTPPSKVTEAFILIAGPLAGLAGGILIGKRWEAFFEVSLILTLVNLLPIRGTDGGSLLQLISSSSGWERLCKTASALSLFGVAAAAFIPLIQGNEPEWLWLTVSAALYLRGMERE